MNERAMTITEQNGTFQISSAGFSSIEMLGVPEQIIFNLKHSGIVKTEIAAAAVLTAEKAAGEVKLQPAPADASNEPETPSTPLHNKPPKAETDENAPSAATASFSTASTATPVREELRTRTGNAVKAVGDLGGKIEDADYAAMNEDELQAEPEALTSQYKRLKMSKAGK